MILRLSRSGVKLQSYYQARSLGFDLEVCSDIMVCLHEVLFASRVHDLWRTVVQDVPRAQAVDWIRGEVSCWFTGRDICILIVSSVLFVGLPLGFDDNFQNIAMNNVMQYCGAQDAVP